MFDDEHVCKWDKNIKTRKRISLQRKCYNLRYLVNKQQYSIAGRDFIEKEFNFFDNGKFYRYTSSVDDGKKVTDEQGNELREDAKTIRAFTVINCGIVERGSDNKINWKMLC